MSRRFIACTAIALVFLSNPAWGQEKDEKKFGKTQAEWIKTLEEHKEKKTRRLAVFILKDYPKTRELMAALIQALGKDAEPDVRREIAAAFGAFGKEGMDTVEALAQRLDKDDNAKVREAAARSLGRLAEHSRTQVVKLGTALKDVDPATRTAAAEALVFFGDTVKPILPQLTDAAGNAKLEDFTRIYAVRILAREFGKDAKIGQLLADILAEKTASLNLRQTVVTALGSMGDSASPAVSILAYTMENTKTDAADDREQFMELRRTAGVALGKIGAPKAAAALPAVLKVLQDPDISMRGQAVRLCGILGKDDAAVAEQLIKLLKEEKNAEVLVAAIQEVAELAIGNAEKQLRELAVDPRAAIRDAAKLSLKRLKGEKQ